MAWALSFNIARFLKFLYFTIDQADLSLVQLTWQLNKGGIGLVYMNVEKIILIVVTLQVWNLLIFSCFPAHTMYNSAMEIIQIFQLTTINVANLWCHWLKYLQKDRISILQYVKNPEGKQLVWTLALTMHLQKYILTHYAH